MIPAVVLAISVFAYMHMRGDVPVVNTGRLAVVSPDNELSADEIFRLVNAERHVRNLPELRLDPKLQVLAQERAHDMATNHYYGHTDSQGRSFFDLFPRYRLNPSYACENLALEFTKDEAEYIQSWLDSSEGHRECLLHPDVVRSGYAVSVFKNGFKFQAYIVVGIHASN